MGKLESATVQNFWDEGAVLLEDYFDRGNWRVSPVKLPSITPLLRLRLDPKTFPNLKHGRILWSPKGVFRGLGPSP